MERKETDGTGLKEVLGCGKEYYEIRLESIGGLGANLCGKMLGELGVKYLDVNSSSFSSYGSEKTGTPVKGYVRYCNQDKEIRVHSPVEEPDLLVIFHQALAKEKTIWKGCGRKSTVLVALETGTEQLQLEYGACAEGRENNSGQTEYSAVTVYGLEAQKIAMETHSRMNVVMFGAALKLMGLENTEAGEQICKDTLGKKYPVALQSNLEGIRRGYREVRRMKAIWTGKAEEKKKEEESTQEWGYKTAPKGGLNPRFGSTAVNDLSPSRQGYIPLFIKERCINCGLCYSTCPDMVFQFVKGEYKGREMMVNQGLDYYHCKGCLRCVEVCPVNALEAGLEAQHPDKAYFLPNQELLRMPEYYEKTGPDGYITSESFLTEKQMEGGEV